MKSLKQARMSKGVTKKAMAEHLGISGPVSYTHLTLPTN